MVKKGKKLLRTMEMSIFKTPKNVYLPKGSNYAFEDDENVNFFNSKKWVFAIGVTPWFQSKNSQFFLVCFSAK